MSPRYEIRRKVARGKFIPVAGPYKLEEAKARVRRLAAIFPAEAYILYELLTNKAVAEVVKGDLHLLSTTDCDSFGILVC
jgi:hypothetical protein